MAANFKWEDLSDVAHKGWELGVRCRCGRTSTLNAQQLLARYRAHGWDTRAAFVHEHLKCAKCGGRPYRVGISADAGRAQSVQGPLTLGGMRKLGIRHVMVDCLCYPSPDTVNVDHLPDGFPVPDVRFRIECPGCGGRVMRTMPHWREQTNRPPGYPR